MYDNPVSYGILLIAMIVAGVKALIKYSTPSKTDQYFNTDWADM